MRQVQALLVMMLFISSLISCKKDSSHTPNHCRIVATYDTIYTATGTGTTAKQILYDNDGRIAYEYIRELTDSAVRVFIYLDSTIVIASPNPRWASDSVHLNSKGSPALINIGYKGSGYNDYMSYSYDGAGLLTSSVSGHYNSKNTTTYTYENGDCVKATSSNGDILNYTYYTDLTTRDGDPQTFKDIFIYGAPTIRNKHLIRTYQFGNFYAQYSYTFDNAGRIKTVVYRCSGYVTVTGYEYDCE